MYDSLEAIAYYEDVAALHASHGVYIVRHIETGQIYIKKVMQVYSLAVYAHLMGHPIHGVPRIYALYENQGALTVIEEYIPGNTLQSLLDKGERFTENEVIHYTAQLCKTLAALHALTPPIIHRDIKPSNIILTEDDRVVLIDLNAARMDVAESDHDTQLLGTSGYAAPEQYGFGKSTVTADIYALGILMQVLLTGGENAPISGNRQPDATSLAKEDLPCSAHLARIIRKCTQLDPDRRYPSADALARALTSRPLRKRIVAMVLLACTVLGIFASIYAYMQDTSGTAAKIDPALVGVYKGDINDVLVLRENGLADYYVSSGYTELAMPWTVTDGILSITFPKLHCTATADITSETSQIYLISNDMGWTDEAFYRTNQTPDEYGHPAVACYDSNTVMNADGYLVCTIGGLQFTLPRQYVDEENSFDDRADASGYWSIKHNRYYEADIVIGEDLISPASAAPDQATIIGRDYEAEYLRTVSYSEGSHRQVAGYDAWICPFTGTTETNRDVTGTLAVIYNKDIGHYLYASIVGDSGAYEAEIDDFLDMLDTATLADSAS